MSKLSDQDIAIQQAVAEERERCAKTCDQLERLARAAQADFTRRVDEISANVWMWVARAHKTDADRIRGEEK